jgi:hypothetical protein
MKIRYLIAGLVTIAAVGMMLHELQKTKAEKQLIDVADAGYETAHDILYPLGRRLRKTW